MISKADTQESQRDIFLYPFFIHISNPKGTRSVCMFGDLKGRGFDTAQSSWEN